MIESARFFCVIKQRKNLFFLSSRRASDDCLLSEPIIAQNGGLNQQPKLYFPKIAEIKFMKKSFSVGLKRFVICVSLTVLSINLLFAENLSAQTALKEDNVFIEKNYGFGKISNPFQESFFHALVFENLNLSAGALDPVFGRNGTVYTSFTQRSDQSYATAIQPDGKILVAGYVVAQEDGGINPHKDFAVARYNPDGTLDATFGGGDGIATASFNDSNHPSNSFDDVARAVAVQPDGKIVAVGYTYTWLIEINNTWTNAGGYHYDLAIARFNADGTLDPTFHNDGMRSYNALLLTTTFEYGPYSTRAASWEEFNSVVILDDGRICGAGSFERIERIVVNQRDVWDLSKSGYARCFNSDGSLGAFIPVNNHPGMPSVEPFNLGQTGSIVKQTDGKILITGVDKLQGIGSYYYVRRYNANLTLDNTFAGDGELATQFLANDAAVQNDGKVVIGGDTAMARFNPDGMPDSTFAGNGTAAVGFGIKSVEIQPDGKIIGVGYKAAAAGNEYEFAVTRFNFDGTPDTSFDGDGVATVSFSGTPLPAFVKVSSALQTNGKIIVTGSSSIDDFVVARFNPDGSLDSFFGDDGKVVTPISGSYEKANAVAIQSDGKIVAAGFSTADAVSSFAVARYNPNGSLDTSFDADGRVLTAVSGNNSCEAHDAAIQDDGKIIAAGYCVISSNRDFALTRYNSDGALDASFGTGGKIITSAGNTIYGVAVQPDGMIVAAGSGTKNSVTGIAVARYTADGVLDNSFGGDGMVVLDFGTNDTATDVKLQSDGKILVAGESSGGNFIILRLDSAGILDNSFDGDGIATTDFAGGADGAKSLIIQPDGKIIAAGYGTVNSNAEFALAKYNADGSLDTSFGIGGKTITPIGSHFDQIEAIALQTDGKPVVTGYRQTFNSATTTYLFDFVLARYNADGTLDTSFDGDGILIKSFAAASDAGNDIAVQADGGIVTAGYAAQNTGVTVFYNYVRFYASRTDDFFIARFLAGENDDTANGSPTVINPGDQFSAENDSVNLQIAAADPNGDLLTYGASGLPDGLSINQQTGLIFGVLSYTSAGVHSVTVTAFDGSLGDSQMFVWTVSNVNRPPTAANLNVVTDEDTAGAITLSGTDEDGDALTFTVTGSPSHGALSGVGANLIYTPQPDYYGADSFTYIADDGSEASVPATVSITVTPVNDAPVLSPVGSQTITAGSTLNLNLSATDVENDILTFSAAVLPDGATLNAATGAFTWMPGSAQGGSYEVTFIVTDSGGANDSETVVIIVGNLLTNVTISVPPFVAFGNGVTLSGVLTHNNVPLPDRLVTFSVGSGNAEQSCAALTSATGAASCVINGLNQPLGPNLPARAVFSGDGTYMAATAQTTTLVFAYSVGNGGGFVIGDKNVGIGKMVTFWGAQWAKQNSLTGGAAPSAFKGIANRSSTTPASCGASWFTDPGNSSNPPAFIPAYMAVMVADSITKNGSVISGNTSKIVIVGTSGNYQPNPGHAGTGTIIGVLCQ